MGSPTVGSTMFKWIKSRGGAKTKHSLADWSPQLAKQIPIINALKEESDRIVIEAERFLKKFELANKANRSAADHLAVTIEKTAECVDRNKELFGEFYPKQIKAFDSLGRIQRRFSVDVREKVIDPLRSFITLDYVRVNNEVQKLLLNRSKVEKEAASCGNGDQMKLNQLFVYRTKQQLKREVYRERVQREYERQLEVVTAEMAKLPRIFANHCKIVKNFGDVLRGYHRDVAKILLDAGASKL